MGVTRPAGFTLVEMIMAISIIGIVAGMVAVFIAAPMQGYADTRRRAELTDQADVALRRISRDVRLALPNSLRALDINGDSIFDSFEFIMTKSGGRYRDPADGSTGGNFLRFTADSNPCGNNRCFDALGPMPAMNGGDRIVVYNLGTGYSPADAYAGGNVAAISGTGAITANPVSLTSNPFASQSPPLPSPSARFQVVDQNDLVVRFTCANGELRRLAGCTLDTPSDCTGATSALLAGSTTEPKAACTVDYQANATGRTGLLYVNLTLTDTPSGESINLFQQIRVDNSP